MSTVTHIPLTVPKSARKAYQDNYRQITQGTGKLVLFAGDQKIEHLNKDFYGEGIHSENNSPEHLFKIASKARIGCFAAQHGLIAQYAKDYPTVPYLVKLNSKTNLGVGDPVSLTLVDFEDVLSLKEAGVNVVAVGYTLYLGSEHEALMLQEIGRVIAEAHSHGLLVVVWMYPRGAGVPDEKHPDIIAGATGVACALGADFVKVNQPQINKEDNPGSLHQAVLAAGRTGVVVSGGSPKEPGPFLHLVYEQLQAGTRGVAVGRNIHQKSLDEAVRMCNALSALVYDGVDTHAAWLTYTQ